MRDAQRENMRQVLDNPTPFTLNSVAIKRASKSNPVALVYVKPIAVSYLLPYEIGGKNKLNSRALIKPVGQKVNQYGNLPRTTLARLKGKARYSVATVKRDSLIGQDGFHGFKEMPRAGSIKMSLRDSGGFPSTAVELLPEWEAALGLPDPCAGESPSLAQRQAQVVARFTNNGGASIAYFVNYAKTLGFDIGISEFTPFRAGQQAAGDSCGEEGWAHTWRINAPSTTINYFRASASTAGEPLATWGNSVLLCEMNTLKPAHTLVIVANPGFLDIDFRLDITTLA
ncbi:putative phage tail protein [Burkholderia glumae]